MLYKILKLLIKPVHRLFYKKIIVEGKENIPDGGVIFTPNHQNALMDAMAIITTSGRNPYFLARADMFTKAFYRVVLRLLRVIPVYRKSDGTQSLDRNKEVFSRASRLLTRNKSLAIFPEAGHNDKNRLQALRKGFVRVGFQAEEYANFETSIAIVPVGVFYTDFTRFNEELHVRYGKPVYLQHYKELYQKNPQKAYNVVKSTVAKRIIPMMINIKNQQYYYTFERIVTIYNERLLPSLGIGKKTRQNLFRARQKVVYLLNLVLEKTPDVFENIRLKVDDYYNDMERLGYDDRSIREALNHKKNLPLNTLLLILTAPVYAYGFIHNILPYIIPRAIAKKGGDIHFISTYKFAYGVVFFTIFYTAEILGMSGLIDGWWLVVYGLSLPVTGLIAYHWNNIRQKLLRQYRLQKAQKNQSGELYELLAKRQQVVEALDKAVESYF